MPEGQKCIYFAAGDDTDRLGKLPNAQLVLSKGYDLLLCTRMWMNSVQMSRLQREGIQEINR